jgi:hypothetical protein
MPDSIFKLIHCSNHPSPTNTSSGEEVYNQQSNSNEQNYSSKLSNREGMHSTAGLT